MAEGSNRAADRPGGWRQERLHRHRPTLAGVRRQAIARGRPMQWVSVYEPGLGHPDLTDEAVDQVVVVAIANGWMLGEGKPPRSVALTEAGRRAGKG